MAAIRLRLPVQRWYRCSHSAAISWPITEITNQDVVLPYASLSPTDPAIISEPQPMSIFGEQRMNLAHEVALIMDEMPQRPRYFLDNGTLLGLWRGGNLIESDDDFDFGLLVDLNEIEESGSSTKWLAKFQNNLNGRLKASGKGYQSRVVDTYANKVEVYDASHGSYLLTGEKYRGAHFHHVTVDLQLHVRHNSKSTKGKERGVASQKSTSIKGGGGVTIEHSDFASRGQAPAAPYEPFGTLNYAERDWPIPGDPKKFLSYLYGYLGLGAEFDNISKLYRRKLESRIEHQDSKKGPLRVYTDMCADLFHVGHVNYLKQCQGIAGAARDVHLMVGIHSDETILSYKRAPICTMQERVGVVEACIHVNQVIPNAPLRVTQEWMNTHDIDMVVHGDQMPEAERQAMYSIPIEQGRYTEVPRTAGVSTTEVIDRIASRLVPDFKDYVIPSACDPIEAVV